MPFLSALDNHRLKILFEHVDTETTGTIDIAVLTRDIERDVVVRFGFTRASLPCFLLTALASASLPTTPPPSREL